MQPRQKAKTIELALQGGGAHGAFTWGVLDRLLEHARLDMVGISGTSAGAMNAVVLADGLCRNGRAGAREALQTFWRAVSRQALSSAPSVSRLWTFCSAPGAMAPTRPISWSTCGRA